MNITFYARESKAKNKDRGELTSKIYIRLRQTNLFDISGNTNLMINNTYWDFRNQKLKNNIVVPHNIREELSYNMKSISDYVEERYNLRDDQTIINKAWLDETLLLYHKKIILQDESNDINTIFSKYLDSKNIEGNRRSAYNVLLRKMKMFRIYEEEDLYKRTRVKEQVTLYNITPARLEDFWFFLINEKEHLDKYPYLYSVISSSISTLRSINTVIGMMKKLRAFIHWCYLEEIIKKNPFDKFKQPVGELYGTPIYITKEEMDKIYNTKMSEALNKQKDIFIFQCSIGCRVGDLLNLKKSNIIGDSIEYVPHKTRNKSIKIVRVPLNDRAKEIISKYQSTETNRLLPFVSEQKYNSYIKEVFKTAGINRYVTIIDPKTRRPKAVNISDIASSHMARRTFIGNIYKNVKDPALISSMTGHTENSRSFARYRNIDDDIKKDLVKFLE